jgi:aryl-phospho-beta-D-glucosidase BglC (GH1 family)
MLPAGYLSTLGNQIVDGRGNPVRIACVGGLGTVVVGGRLTYDFGTPYKTVDSNIAAMRKVGFNCIRVDFNDKSVSDPVLMSQFDALVAACTKYGLKVIFDNHNNEATPANWGNAAQQRNGLWFDKGPGSDDTDGAGDKGTITSEQFTQDWIAMARHWAGNPTVIGFDIRNEPCYTSTPPLWGGGGPTDICAMYERVGDAIQAVDPGALIICEAVINYPANSYEGDFSHPDRLPIKLTNPAKLVYSVHEYPKEIGGYSGPQSGPGYIERMNRTWGWLITKKIAPVWIGEMGCSMDSVGDFAWAETLMSYMNGAAPNGIRFSNSEQPISGDWWCWGCLPDENPDGCLTSTGELRPEQAQSIDQMLYRPTLAK